MYVVNKKRRAELLCDWSTRRRGIFKGVSQDGGREDFAKNLRASLFNNKYISNEPNFSRVYLIVRDGWQKKNVF